ncbi:hypothetical protein ES703_12805 [subsurface metagenome]
MKEGGAVAVLGLGLAGLVGVAGVGLLMVAAAEEPEEELPVLLPEEEEEAEVEVIDAEFRSGYAFWAALTEWRQVYTRWPNEWPADTDITFAWEIRNTGNVGAYFQVYAFEPGSWLYLDPGERVKVFEEWHTPTLPVTPGYEYARITILGRKITGERIGSVWTSNEIEIHYV